MWPIEVKLGTTIEKGMDTTHTLKIWCEFVRVVGDTEYESKFRLSTKDQNGFDYFGSYFKIFRKWISWFGWALVWCSVGAGVTTVWLLVRMWMSGDS